MRFVPEHVPRKRDRLMRDELPGHLERDDRIRRRQAAAGGEDVDREDQSEQRRADSPGMGVHQPRSSCPTTRNGTTNLATPRPYTPRG